MERYYGVQKIKENIRSEAIIKNGWRGMTDTNIK